MSQALYRKWRPRQWDEVVGQDHVVQTLRNSVVAGRVAHAYLFAGPRGTGKTTTARLLAKAVNCLDDDLAVRPCDRCDHCLAVNAGRFLDLIEIDAASNTSVDDVRDLREKINFAPNQGRYKVYIIDEVHMLSTAAFNALLKTLEEPPPHAIFILATTEVHKIPATVLSRCQRHEFRRIPVTEIVAYLRNMAGEEDINVSDEALTLVARQSTGAMRDAISLLDQLASTGQAITLELAQNVLGTAANQSVLNLVDALLERDPRAGLENIHRALDAGSDPRQYARQVVDYLRDLLLISTGNANQVDATAEVRAQMARHAQAFEASELLRVIRIFNAAGVESRGSWQPALPLEMAFVESLQSAENPQGEAPETAPASAAPLTSEAKPPRSVKEKPDPTVEMKEKPSEDEQEEASEDTPASRRIWENWQQILIQVRQQNPKTYGLLNSSKSRSFKNGVLVLGFASDLLKHQMEKRDNIELVVEILKQVVGTEVAVRCQTKMGKNSDLPPNVDTDGIVATALNDLGGEIVDIQ
jgi:DNA polymerase-3 subunit gamma/tau